MNMSSVKDKGEMLEVPAESFKKLVNDNEDFAIKVKQLELIHQTLKTEYDKTLLSMKIISDRSTKVNDSLHAYSRCSDIAKLLDALFYDFYNYFGASLIVFYPVQRIARDKPLVEEEFLQPHSVDYLMRGYILPDIKVMTQIFNRVTNSSTRIRTLTVNELNAYNDERIELSHAVACKFNEDILGFIVIAYEDMNVEIDRELMVSIVELFSTIYNSINLNQVLAELLSTTTVKAMTDPRTGIPNISQFEKDLPEYAKGKYSLIMMDADKFKSVNDTYGHDVGDEVISFMAKNLHAYLSSVGGSGYRYGGDEFIGIAPMSALDTLDLITSLKKLLTEHKYDTGKGTQFSITNSYGIYEPYLGEDLETVKKKTDELLYSSKETGRNKITHDSYKKD